MSCVAAIRMCVMLHMSKAHLTHMNDTRRTNEWVAQTYCSSRKTFLDLKIRSSGENGNNTSVLCTCTLVNRTLVARSIEQLERERKTGVFTAHNLSL